MNKKKKPHLLIVGGSGFIGYHLAIQAKKKEWKVTSISIHNPNRYRYIKDGKEHYSKTGSYINGSYIEDDLSICKKLNETIF